MHYETMLAYHRELDKACSHSKRLPLGDKQSGWNLGPSHYLLRPWKDNHLTILAGVTGFSKKAIRESVKVRVV